jgi:hypothetical protein
MSFLILSLVFIIYVKQKTYKKNSDNLIKILNSNVQFLNDLYKKHEVVELKKAIDLYSQFQIILKMSKCDYVSFFKYDYSKRYIVLHFILSVDSNGRIHHTDILDKLPLTANLSMLNILKSDDDDLYNLPINEIEGKNDDLLISLRNKGISTIYYQNIFKNKENPLGFVSLGYKTENYVLPQEDKVEILRVIEKMKTLI